MVAVPVATPLTTPDEFTVATAVLLLAQVPPATASDKVVVDPAQTVVVPVIVLTEGFTVTTAVSYELHPLYETSAI